MTSLSSLKNVTRDKPRSKRVGRGPGSGKGKTCGRGEKGAGARSGYKRRYGYEGGQFRTFMKLPIRGFNNAAFRFALDTINLGQIEALYEEGEVVNKKTLIERGFISRNSNGIKILGNGDLQKKVKIEADAASHGARKKMHEGKLSLVLPKDSE
jgi:large subunit ribosomal protein L15